MAKSIKFKNDNYIDSTGVVHNKTKLSDILNYSTEPILIGKWIDGKKKVYKKVIYNDNESTSSILIDFNFADIILNVYGSATMSNGVNYFINGGNSDYSNGKDWFLHAVWIAKNNDWKAGNLYIFPSVTLSSEKIIKHYIVVEYVQ